MINDTFHSESKDYINSIGEDRCCTVVTLAIVTGQPLDKCFEFMARCGRLKRRGLASKELRIALSRSRKYKFCHKEFEKPKTVKQFIKDHPVGRYYVVVSGHAFAIIDGVVYDHSDRPLRRVKEAWRVYDKPG